MITVVVLSDKPIKNFFCGAFFIAAVVIFIAILLVSMPAAADMKRLAEEELSQITATGFSRFTLTEGVTDIARIELNLMASTYTDIGTVKMGYWDNGAGQGWDQSWQSVSFGSNGQDLVLKDFVFEAEFQNISDSSNRQLQGITIGFADVTGTISTDFGTFSGSIKGIDYDRSSVGLKTVTLNNEPFLLMLKISNGVSFKIGW